MLKLIQLMMEETIKEERAPRDFRVKYPDELLQDELAGQLWFGAEVGLLVIPVRCTCASMSSAICL